jgi:hypothetical protein
MMNPFLAARAVLPKMHHLMLQNFDMIAMRMMMMMRMLANMFVLQGSGL